MRPFLSSGTWYSVTTPCWPDHCSGSSSPPTYPGGSNCRFLPMQVCVSLHLCALERTIHLGEGNQPQTAPGIIGTFTARPSLSFIIVLYAPFWENRGHSSTLTRDYHKSRNGMPRCGTNDGKPILDYEYIIPGAQYGHATRNQVTKETTLNERTGIFFSKPPGLSLIHI